MTFNKYVDNDKNILKHISKGGTKILLTKFKIVHFIEWVLIFLHFFLLGFTIVSLIAISFEDVELAKQIFEICALIFIVFLFIFLFLKRIIVIYLIRKNLAPIWGPNKFDKTIVKPEQIIYDQKHLWGNITKSATQHFKEETFLGWKNHCPFRKTLVISSRTPNGNVFSTAVKEIYINSEKKLVILSAAFYDPEIKGDREFVFIFDVVKQTVSWSGVLPHNPSYGQWILD